MDLMQTILAIDWGSKYCGVARGNNIGRIATPLGQLANDSQLLPELNRLVEEESVAQVIVGLPRNLEGKETAQSEEIRQFARELEETLQCPVLLQDETLSTISGQQLKQKYPRADKDSLAAAIILQDYLNTL